MDAVKILNSYRFAVAEDAKAVRLLAVLFRSGPQSDVQLEQNAATSLQEVRAKLNELYRAQLVHIVAGERWATTDLADQVLSRLGVAEVAARSLLEKQQIGDSDRSFLMACMDLRSAHDEGWPRFQTGLLRALAHLERHEWADLHGPQGDLTPLLYGAIVGLDADAQQLGGKNYCKLVLHWHCDAGSELWNRWGFKWLEGRAAYERRCDLGVKLAIDSNAFLASSDYVARGQPGQLALLRVLSTVASDTPDAAMGAAVRLNPDLPSDIWGALARTFPDLEARVGTILVEWGKVDPGRKASWSGRFRSILDEAFPRSQEARTSLRDLTGAGEARARLAPMRGAWLEGTLLRMKAQIDAGDYDELPLAARADLIALFDEARVALNGRPHAGASVKKPGGKKAARGPRTKRRQRTRR